MSSPLKDLKELTKLDLHRNPDNIGCFAAQEFDKLGVAFS